MSSAIDLQERYPRRRPRDSPSSDHSRSFSVLLTVLEKDRAQLDATIPWNWSLHWGGLLRGVWLSTPTTTCSSRVTRSRT